jgi:GNAT superfamily N-acetyltransferase
MTTNLSIAIETDAPADDIKVLTNGLIEHASALGVGEPFHNFAVFARDSHGTIRGGLTGNIRYGMMYVSVLWVHDHERGKGLGRQLMAMAEAEGLKRGCHISGLSTLSYQAPEFYQKIGYVERSRIEGLGSDRNITRIDFIKQMA